MRVRRSSVTIRDQDIGACRPERAPCPQRAENAGEASRAPRRGVVMVERGGSSPCCRTDPAGTRPCTRRRKTARLPDNSATRTRVDHQLAGSRTEGSCSPCPGSTHIFRTCSGKRRLACTAGTPSNRRLLRPPSCTFPSRTAGIDRTSSRGTRIVRCPMAARSNRSNRTRSA
jgi:hypothetical protein